MLAYNEVMEYYSDLTNSGNHEKGGFLMKKTRFVAIMLIIITVVLACGSACCDNENVYFDPILLGLVDMNAKEWMESTSNRALLAACSLLDYALQDDIPYDLVGLYSGTVYVGREALILATGYNNSDKEGSLIVLYDTSTGKCAYRVMKDMSKARLAEAMEGVCTDGYYKIDLVDLKEHIDAIRDIINGD